MKIIKAGYEIMTPLDGAKILRHIERCGRVCYKPEGSFVDLAGYAACTGEIATEAAQ